MAIEDNEIIEMAPRVMYMMQTPGWSDYIRVISDRVASMQETAFAGAPEDLRFYQGIVQGLRAAVLSGEDVTTVARSLTGEKLEARKRAVASHAPISSFD